MEIRVVNGDAINQETQALVVNLFAGVKEPGGATGAVDNAINGLITQLIEDGEISGSSGELTLLHTPTAAYPGLKAERVIVVGLGDSDSFDLETVRSVGASVARRLRSIGVTSAASIAHGAGIGGLEPGQSAEAFTEGAMLGLYRFDKYKSSPSDGNGGSSRSGPDLIEIIESDATKIKALEDGIKRGGAFASATAIARDLVNEPPNVLSPTALTEAAKQVSAEAGLECIVLDADKCREMGMLAYLGVAQGSKEPPSFVRIDYKGDPGDADNNLWIVGKGITFDSGGLSLKSSAGMFTMKGDMGGGAAVIGAMQAIAVLKPKINVFAVCAATENMPGGAAQRPGDVVTAMSGKTIEIENTDAEGRLTLADAIEYARNEGAKRIVDIATLTGAVSIALGKGHIGAFSNDHDLYSAVEEAGASKGELVWRLPLGSVTKRQNNSRVADLKNTGGRLAGSITAAHFIGEFAGDTPWVHLDIAAVNMADSNSGVDVPGATGASTRLLIQLALDLGQ